MFKHFLISSAVLALSTSAQAGHVREQFEDKKITKAPSSGTAGDAIASDLGGGEIKVAPADETSPSDAPAPATSGPAPASVTATPAPAAKTEAKGVPAETALRWLTNGNIRFATKNFRKDGRSADDRKRLLSTQRPHAIVLACSDSRVPPELVFDQALGEIVTIRVAGPALDAAVIATLEETLENLDPHLIVVMGHDRCSTIESAFKVKDGATVGSSNIGQVLSDVRQRLKTIPPEKLSPNFEVESAVNADGVGRELLKRSEIVRKKVEAGDLVIKPALYHLESGKVSFY